MFREREILQIERKIVDGIVDRHFYQLDTIHINGILLFFVLYVNYLIREKFLFSRNEREGIKFARDGSMFHETAWTTYVLEHRHGRIPKATVEEEKYLVTVPMYRWGGTRY